MGLFDFFKSEREIAKEEISKIPWSYLENVEQLDDVDTLSKSRDVLIFKHSTSCGISRMVLRQFEDDYSFDEKMLKPYLLDLRKNRGVSNEVASRYGVIHESPQILLIRNGGCVYDTSHGAITVDKIKERLV
ncbi:MAG: bacillithiol system redox-active protein YtxJ [Cytophagaceae bacterium]|nr:bacillithiol system redox-active protein YtxJ [Cytophagaceae bacterium]|tara:strand:+ start:242 stop:637 length:396 start_codon:yes stop_codon:yes gene_type:complete